MATRFGILCEYQLHHFFNNKKVLFKCIIQKQFESLREDRALYLSRQVCRAALQCGLHPLAENNAT